MTLDYKDDYEEKCENNSEESFEFKLHPCNFNVKINQIQPFNVYALKSIVLNLQVINHYNVNSCIKIKSKPMYGNVYLIDPSTLVYQSTRRFSGLDIFKILIEDECGGSHTENILINVICK